MEQIIIELPEWQYENIKSMTQKANPVDIGVMINAMTSIANGIVIPNNAVNGMSHAVSSSNIQASIYA